MCARAECAKSQGGARERSYRRLRFSESAIYDAPMDTIEVILVTILFLGVFGLIAYLGIELAMVQVKQSRDQQALREIEKVLEAPL